jgi:hypothetical protein
MNHSQCGPNVTEIGYFAGPLDPAPVISQCAEPLEAANRSAFRVVRAGDGSTHATWNVSRQCSKQKMGVNWAGDAPPRHKIPFVQPEI